MSWGLSDMLVDEQKRKISNTWKIWWYCLCIDRTEYISDSVVINADEHESYIYVCGINPCKNICIDKNITLEPVSPVANPDDMIDCFMKNGNGNEFQMDILISTLRMVTAQLRITYDNPEELTVLTWNAQHVCIQISALLNCDVSWYF